ncbi:hypothetical protein H9P43_007982 [Blastocladiella emersonii ATCC 22665]|nr:hypothetical protein H9P43_007982 [Blastocladiella emersonii ATCC 22665]
MLTATTKALLSPIADAVAQLVVITAHAELHRTPIPDLRDVAALVAEHVHKLASIGMGLIDADALAAETRGHVDVSKLQAAMNEACISVVNAANLLVGVAQTLSLDPLSAAGRAQLVDATKGILQGTQGILNTFDDSEVQKIVVVAQSLITHVVRLHETASTPGGGPVAHFVPRTRDVAQQALFLYHLVHARIPELLSPALQKILAQWNAQLDRAAVAGTAAVQVVATHPDSAPHIGILGRHVNDAAEACRKIVEVVMIEDMAEGGAAGSSSVSDALAPSTSAGSSSASSSLATPVWRDPLDQVTAAIARVSSATSDISPSADSAVAAATVSPAVTPALAAVASLRSAIESHRTWSAADPETRATLCATADLLSSALAAHADPASPVSLAAQRAGRIRALADTLAGQLTAAETRARGIETTALVDALARLRAHGAEDGQKTLVEKMLADPTRAASGEFEDVARAAVAGMYRAGVAHEVAAKVEALVPSVVEAAQVLALEAAGGGADSDSAASNAVKEYVAHVVGEWDAAVEAAHRMVVATVAADTLIASWMTQVDQVTTHIAAAKTALATTPGHAASAAALKGHVSKLASLLAGFVGTVQREADNSEDAAYRGTLVSLLARAPAPAAGADDGYADRVKAFVQECATAVGEEHGITLALGPIAPVAAALVSEPALPPPPPSAPVVPEPPVVEAVTAAVAQLAIAVPPPAPEPIVDEDVVIVEADAPQPLSPEEAQANPLRAVAQDLIVETSRWSRSGNDLVHTAAEMSSHLATIADYYRQFSPQAKLSLVSSTRDVVKLADTLQRLVQALANACTDRRLRLDLLAAANRVPTLSQQLKILASVRASAGANVEGDSERQIVTCAQNLLVAVKDVLGKSEAASIRVNARTVGNVGLAVVKFKRNLFRGRKGAATGAAAVPRLPTTVEEKEPAPAPVTATPATVGVGKAWAAAAAAAKSTAAPAPAKAPSMSNLRMEDLLTLKKAGPPPARPGA